MWALITSFLKSLIEFLKLGKWIYQETKDTPIEKEAEIEAHNGQEKETAKKEGRPSWD